MVQVIENRSDIRGRIRSLNDSGDFPGLATALIDVLSVAPVPGFANLFQEAHGNTARVNIPRAAVQKFHLGPGQLVTLRVRKGGPNTAFADPEQVSVEIDQPEKK